MAWFGDRMAVQRRLALGYGVMVLDLIIIGVIGIVWLGRGLESSLGMALIGVFIAVGVVLGILLTWLIPYGFTSFYPASYLTGRSLGWLAWLAPLVAAILLLIGYQVWKFGLRHYAGTGS